MQNNLKNIEYYKFNRINKKKAHIVLIFIFIVLYILFSFNMIIYGVEEKDIVGDTKVGLEVGEQKELVYTIDRKYILQIDKIKKNNSNISVMKTYTSESPSICLTLGFSIVPKNCLAYADKLSIYLLCPSAYIVSNASDDFP